MAPEWFIRLYTEFSQKADLYGRPWEAIAREFWDELQKHLNPPA